MGEIFNVVEVGNLGGMRVNYLLATLISCCENGTVC